MSNNNEVIFVEVGANKYVDSIGRYVRGIHALYSHFFPKQNIPLKEVEYQLMYYKYNLHVKAFVAIDGEGNVLCYCEALEKGGRILPEIHISRVMHVENHKACSQLIKFVLETAKEYWNTETGIWIQDTNVLWTDFEDVGLDFTPIKVSSTVSVTLKKSS